KHGTTAPNPVTRRDPICVRNLRPIRLPSSREPRVEPTRAVAEPSTMTPYGRSIAASRIAVSANRSRLGLARLPPRTPRASAAPPSRTSATDVRVELDKLERPAEGDAPHVSHRVLSQPDRPSLDRTSEANARVGLSCHEHMFSRLSDF